MVERLNGIQEVRGSTPLVSTKKESKSKNDLLSFLVTTTGSIYPFCKANGVRKFLRVTHFVQIIIRVAHIIAKTSLAFC